MQTRCTKRSDRDVTNKKSLSAGRDFFIRLRCLFNLNFYAILLSLLLIFLLILFFFVSILHKTWIHCTVYSMVLFAFLLAIVHIYADYPLRKRIFLALLRKNKKGIDQNSFAEFMSVPCHRKVCWEVLRQLEQDQFYSILKKRYGIFLDPQDLQGYYKIYNEDKNKK